MANVKFFNGENIPLEMHKVRIVQKLNLRPVRERAEELLRDSHKRVLAAIVPFSDEELFEKKHFSWTGTSSLGSYCVSATSAHYEWAAKKVKAHIKAGKA